MLHRIRGLFQRYERRHRHVTGPGFALFPRGAARTGHVDRVVLEGNTLRVTGWSTAGRVMLSSSTGRVETRPDIARQDVADALGLPLRVGFELSLAHGPGPITLTAGDHAVTRMPIRVHRMAWHRLVLMGRFAGAVLGAVPSIWRALRHHDAAARDRVKTALGLQAITTAAPIDPALFDGPAAPGPVAYVVPVTIVLPVYNAFDLLPEVLERVVRHTDLPWHLILIEDCSSDPQVRPWLRQWAAGHHGAPAARVELIENDTNLGFIGSVNAAWARAIELGHHVILLNSDAFVPEKWASRLMRPLLRDAGVATVTPMSNDAEIFSMPVICQPTPLKPGQGDALDALARGFGAAPVVVPTGVGFCMAMNLDYLRQVPALDPVFGRGYGEEVDWCQKVRALGGRHLGLPGLFVEHRGGHSFGSAAKQALILKNNETIAHRYPGYDAEVQGVIEADPLAGPRLALAIGWAAGQGGGALPVYLAHALGGGADTYLERRIDQELGAGAPGAVVLRVGGATRWQVELITARGRVAGTTDDFAMVEHLLEPVTTRHIVYSCGVGDPDPVTLPGHLLALKRGDGDRIEVLVHDFFMLSPSYTLLDRDGVYRGPLRTPRADPAHTATRPDGSVVPHADWRAAWAALLEQADEIVVFSADSRAQMLAAHPGLEPRLKLRPHTQLARVAPIAPGSGKGRVIGVLGNIGYQKGAAVLVDLGRALDRLPDLGLVILGNVDPAYMPPPSVPVHGDYRIEDLARLVERYGITDWLIPSVWPETFSYTTHECLATGLPVYAFDIGAQGAAVAAAQNGRVIPFAAGGDLAQAVLERIKQGL